MVNTKSKTKKTKQASIDNQYGARIGSSEDLLTEILIRLPVTSILRFKSVCKHWRLLLTHTHFTHRYDNTNLSKSVGLFGLNTYVPFDVKNLSPPPFRSLDFHFSRSCVKIMHSCNGLLLCYTFHNGAREYYVFNPTTKQLAFIPSVPKRICSMALAFHQRDCVRYKVVCICTLQPNRNLIQVQVYSSDTRTWKICIKYYFVHKPKFRNPVYWNGAVHWAPYYRSSNYLYFKLDVEQLQTLPLPEGLVFDDMSKIYFGESRDHLHLIFSKEHKYNILRLSVYEMLRDHSGWFVKYRLQLQLDELPYPYAWYMGVYVEVIDVVRGKEEENTFLVLLTSWNIIRYNVYDKSSKELSSYNAILEEVPSFHRYIETLSSF